MQSDNAATIAAVAASIQTVGQARAALGAASDLLKQAYEKLPVISTTADLRQAASDRLDVVNAYASGIYAILPADDASQGNQIDTLTANRVGLALAQSQDALKDIEDTANLEIWNIRAILTDAISTAATWTGGGIQAVTNAVAAGGSAFVASAWPTLLIVGVVLAGLLLLRSGKLPLKVPA
jgi:hypothetical protein